MLTVTAIAYLRRHQDALLALVAQVATLLEEDAAAARLPLAAARWSIVRRAREYQLFKHTEIFAPAIAGGPPARASQAEELRRACLAASADFEAYLRRWSARDVVAEWALHRAEAWAVVRRMRRHLTVERQQVERLLAGSEQVRQPVSVAYRGLAAS